MTALLSVVLAACGGGGGSTSTDDTATPGVIVEAVPAAVTDLTATSSNDAIVLSFKVANPQNVTAFEAVCTGSGPTVTARSPSHGTATDTITVTGLTNPQSYTCTVSAINSSGAGVASSPVQPTADPSTGNGTPDAPSALHMDAAPTSVVISFSEASVSGGSAVSSYVGICVGDKTAYSYAVASPITVLGLTEGVAYTCSVTAVNAQGLGTPSATSVVTPLAKAAATAGAPAAPTLSAVKGAPSSAVVEFNKTSVGASAAKRRSLGSATESGTLYHATCSKDDSVVSVESAGSPITVPQLVNGATYSCTVAATTTAGTSDPSNAMTVVPRTVPEAPTLTLVSAGDRIATLSFTAPAGSPGTPADGGSTITGYHATCTGGTQTATGDATSAGSVVVAGLVNDQQYTCSVAAVNAAGTGKASAGQPVTPVASTAPTGGTVANAPQDVRVTTTDTTAVISFTPVTDSSLPVLDYTATCTGADSIVTATASSSPITVSGLSYGVSYSCVVTARTRDGSGTPSEGQPAKPAGTVPAAPTLIDATPGDAAITLVFTANSDGGSAVTAFTGTCGDDKTGTAATSPVTVTGLSNGTIYACSVTATNTFGTGPSSGTKNARPRTVPQPPTAVQAKAGNTTITVTYTEPINKGGAEITGYTAWCQNGNNIFTAPSTAATDTSITLSGLSNDSEYTCWVTASNTAGPSVASDPTVKATPSATVVEAPLYAATNLGKSAGDGTLTVTFDRPASNDASTTTYELICSPDGIDISAGPASQVTAKGTNGTTYTCWIRAKRGLQQSDSGVVVVTPNAKPAAPALSVTVGDRQLNYSFTRVDGLTYTATCYSGAIDGNSFSVTGLTNDQPFSCTLTATNSGGSTDSAVATATPKAATPDALPATPVLTVSAIGDRQLGFSFTPATVTGVTYTASCMAGGSSAGSAGAIANGAFTVTGLTNSTSYGCTLTASNQAGPVNSNTVYAKPNVKPDKPTIAVSAVGDRLITYSFTPAPNVEKYSASCTSLTPSNTVGEKTFTVTTLSNLIDYYCTLTAENNAGSATSDRVLGRSVAKPTAPSGITVTLGDASATLSFSGNNGSGSGVTYSATCVAGDSFTANANGSLTVKGLTNGSTYANCGLTATNGNGDKTTAAVSSFTLPAAPTKPVIQTPSPSNNQVTLTFSPAQSGVTYSATCVTGDSFTKVSSTQLTVTGLVNGSTYSNCRVTATNDTGGAKATSDAALAFTLPATPTKPVISQAAPGDAQIVLSFSPNAESNVDYTGSCGGASYNKGSDGKVTVTGLTNGTAYTCKVTALSSSNVPVTSDSSASVTPLAPATALPGAPTYSASNTVIGDGTLKFKFGKPGSNGTDTTTYSASCKTTSSGASVAATVDTSTNPFTVSLSGLTNGSSYTCTAVATNSKGSASTVASATSYTAPTSPALLPEGQGSFVGNKTATLAFMASSSSGDASSSLVYTATCTNIANAADEKNASASASPLVVSALTNGATYICSVTAKNSHALVSAPSAPLSLSLDTAPNALTASKIVIQQNSTCVSGKLQITISYEAPAANGTAITGYQLSWSVNGSSGSASNGASATSFTVLVPTGLDETFNASIFATSAHNPSETTTKTATTIFCLPPIVSG